MLNFKVNALIFDCTEFSFLSGVCEGSLPLVWSGSAVFLVITSVSGIITFVTGSGFITLTLTNSVFFVARQLKMLAVGQKCML